MTIHTRYYINNTYLGNPFELGIVLLQFGLRTALKMHDRISGNSWLRSLLYFFVTKGQ